MILAAKIGIGVGSLLAAGLGFGAYRRHHNKSMFPVAPPGVPQPPGTVEPPYNPTVPATDPVHAAAAKLMSTLSGMSATQQPFADCSNFQGAFNATTPPPSTPLATDGRYGPKTQAALQSVVAPAFAPSNFFPSSGANSAVPSAGAAPANPNVDVNTAANTLVAYGSSIQKGSLSDVTTFQHAYNLTGPAQPLTEDGKYGPMSQAALQSVLNASGSGAQAPSNGYGPVGTIPMFSGGVNVDPSVVTAAAAVQQALDAALATGI